MSFAFTIELIGTARADFQRVIDNLRRADLRKVMGRAIVSLLRRHFTTLDRTRANKLGGERTHFWGDVRRSVQQPELVGGDGIKISIPHVGAAQRFFGGPIVAGANGSGKKFLTIPVNAEAHGKRAGEFDDLHAIFFDDGTGILARDNEEQQGEIGEVFYRLVRRVTQRPDPTVLPTEEEMTAAAFTEGDAYLDTLIARKRGYSA